MSSPSQNSHKEHLVLYSSCAGCWNESTKRLRNSLVRPIGLNQPDEYHRFTSEGLY